MGLSEGRRYYIIARHHVAARQFAADRKISSWTYVSNSESLRGLRRVKVALLKGWEYRYDKEDLLLQIQILKHSGAEVTYYNEVP